MKMKAKRAEIITQCTRENKPTTEKTTALVFGDYGYHKRTDF